MNSLRKIGICTQWSLFSHKKNEIVFAGKGMDLENIKLSEVSQAQKVKGHMFSLICGS
jgi:hypothetical protein